MVNDIKNENAFLREQLNLLPRDQYNLVSAFVVSQDPNETGNWLEIDKGSNDGITVGMPVIVSKGILIGRVQQVNSGSSQISLLTNPKSTINIMDVASGAKGVAKGEYGLGIIFDMVLQTDSINVGDSVVTSGVGSEIPRGLYIGTIQEIHQSDDHLFQQAVLTAPLQVSKLQMVFVIKNSK
jgi:rod shape-determining protein MreC